MGCLSIQVDSASDVLELYSTLVVQAIQSIVKRTGTKTRDDAVESAERDAASTKFAKSLKQFIEKPEKKKKIDEQKAKRIREE